MKSKQYQFNFKLVPSVLFLFFFIGFIRLGFWQLDRAEQKNILNDAYASRQSDSIIQLNDIGNVNDLNLLWKKVELKGSFKNEQNIILDNQIFQQTAGFNIITPFRISGTDWSVLVNRGWQENLNLRSLIPDIQLLKGEVVIGGSIVKFPVGGIVLGEENLEVINSSISRVQRVDIDKFSDFYSAKFLPYIIYLDPLLDSKYQSNFKLPAPDSDKNYGYSLQWFAFAFTLLIIFLSLGIKTRHVK